MNNNIKFATETLGNTYEELRPILHILKKNIISSNTTSDDFMIKCTDLIDWTVACRSVQLSENVIRHACNQDGFDWKVAVVIQSIPTDVLEEHMDKVDWEDVQKNQVLSLQFIKNHKDAVNVELILKSKQYPQETLNYFMGDSNPNNVYNLLNIMLTYQKPNEEFLEQHWDLIDKDVLLKNQKLSEEFIRKHLQDFDINTLASTQELPEDILVDQVKNIQKNILSKINLPEPILMEHISLFDEFDVIKYQNITRLVYGYLKNNNDKIDTELFNYRIKSREFKPIENKEIRDTIINTFQNWEQISYEKNLNIEFIKEFQSKLKMRVVVNNTTLTSDDIAQLNLNSIERYMWFIQQKDVNIKNDHLSFEFWWEDDSAQEVISQMSDLEKSAFIELFRDNSNLVQIVKTHQLPVWVLELMKDEVSWYWVCRYQKMSSETIDSFIQYIDPTYLVEYQNLSEEFIMKYKDILMWDLVCRYQIITPRIIRELNNYIDIDSMKLNKVMTCVDIDNCIREYNQINNI